MDGQLGWELNSNETDKELDSETYSPLSQVLPFGDDNAPRAISVSCGDWFSLVLDDSYNVSSFGKGTHGRLGHGNDQNVYQPQIIKALKQHKIIKISAGCRHAAAVAESGDLYWWGFNFYEQLGLGNGDKDILVPTKVPDKHFSSSEDKIQIKSISCGYFHSGCVVSNI